MMCGCSVAVLPPGFGLWRRACSSCGNREGNTYVAAAGARGVDPSQHAIAAGRRSRPQWELLIKATLQAISAVCLVSPLAESVA